MSSIRVEAESLTLNGYFFETGNFASNGGYISLLEPGNLTAGVTGTASYDFTGAAGLYDIVIGYYDENDGVGQLELQIDNAFIDSWNLNQTNGSGGASAKSFRTFTVARRQLNPGQTITLLGTASDPAGEWARVDYIEFIPLANPPPPSPPPPPAGQPIRIEAEAIIDSGYQVESNNAASGNQLVSLFKTGNATGRLTTQFNGATGLYQVVLGYFDENDGQSSISVEIGSNSFDWTWDQNLGKGWATSQTKVERTIITDLNIAAGETITLTGIADQGEWARVDYIEFIPLGNPQPPPPPSPNPGNLSFSAASFSINEDGTPVQTVTINRTGGSDGPVSVTVTPSDGSATAPSDYSNSPILASFVGGESGPKTVLIPVVNDTVVENTETINLSLSSPTGGASLGSQTTAILSIIDDDSAASPPPLPGNPIQIEAEDMTLTDYQVESDKSPASGNQLITLLNSGSNTGSATTEFSGADGVYDIEIAYFDETDGQGKISVQIGSNQSTLNLNQNLGSGGVSHKNRVKKQVFAGLQIANREQIILTGEANQGEWARIDAIKFTPASNTPPPPPPPPSGRGNPIRFEAEDMNRNGYRIESNNAASGQELASLFNTGNSTGSLTTQFNGATGAYQVVLGYFDENDGQASLSVQIGNNNPFDLTLDQNLGKGWATGQTRVERTIAAALNVAAGDTITITGAADQGEWARVDFIEFIPPRNDPPPPTGNIVSYTQATSGVTADLSKNIVSAKFGALPNQSIKVLPLGDSNTRGFPNKADNGGYRTQLWNQLEAGGFSNVNFVGRLASGPSSIDRNHEGRGGFTIEELTNGGGPVFQQPAGVTPPDYGKIEDALANNPDVVLLMAGTNDIQQSDSANTALNELGTLVDRITAARPNTQVLVASLIPNTSNASREATTTEFSNRVFDKVVKPRANNGKSVSFVDIFNTPGLKASDFQSDGIHLKSSGYDKIADVWYDSLIKTNIKKNISNNIDSVTGSAYDDVLIGDANANVIDGGKGDDLLTGGGKGDLFVLAPGNGMDTIIDFQVGLDWLGLSGGLRFDQLTITQGSNQNVDDTFIKITSSNESLAILNNTQATDLIPTSFTIV